jgi:hypothetical protein
VTKKCHGNVHERGVVVVTSSGKYGYYDAKNVVDLQRGSDFCSVYRKKKEGITHTRNNWLCYDFRGRRIIPSHYSIRTDSGDSIAAPPSDRRCDRQPNLAESSPTFIPRRV